VAAGDGRIVAGAGAGGEPLVNVFNAGNGSLLNSFDAFAPAFRGGTTVAISSIPEPSGLVLAALGFAVMYFSRRFS